ncbi:hypothetical protein [Ideonella sp. YS5]|uniref:hypothetical protein n=1 Tax=Ideonella sp. YS5 TaxID=3453714 RepID=UPI003EEB24C5
MVQKALALAAFVSALLGSSAVVADQRNQLPLGFKDANGKTVGRVLWSGGSYVVMREDKKLFALRMGVTGPDFTKANFESIPLVYETTDCSGPAYLKYDFQLIGVSLATVVHPNDGRTLVYVVSDINRNIVVQSERDKRLNCKAGQYNGWAAPVGEPIDITGKYSPPFTMR